METKQQELDALQGEIEQARGFYDLAKEGKALDVERVVVAARWVAEVPSSPAALADLRHCLHLLTRGEDHLEACYKDLCAALDAPEAARQA